MLMTIWVIGRSYPTKQNKMSGSFELEQAKLIAKYGEGKDKVSYITVCFHPFRKIRKRGYCSFEEDGVSIYADSVLFVPDKLHIHLKPFRKFIWKRLLQKVEKETGIPDVIHVHYPALITVPEPILEYQKKGTRVVLTEHWTKVLNNTIDSFQRKQLTQYVQNADRVICVGQPLKESIQKITGADRKLVVIPNVVSNLFYPERNAKGKCFNFVTVGRLVPVKQMDQVALAFSKAFAGREDITLTVVGGGGERKKIESVIKSYHMESQILMTGTLSREETAQKVRAADALVCFSRLETFGVPVIEAWASGIPAIATDCLGFLEYWTEDLGILVRHDKPEELETAMKLIHSNSDRYDAEKISRFAQDNFSEPVVYHKLMQIYKET